jgi:hypothetical protein
MVSSTRMQPGRASAANRQTVAARTPRIRQPRGSVDSD